LRPGPRSGIIKVLRAGWIRASDIQMKWPTQVLAMILLAALLGAACDDKACDPASRPSCVNSLGNGQCTDVAQEAVCNDAHWTCPAGSVRQEECLCTGPPPAAGCTCAGASVDEGWSCP